MQQDNIREFVPEPTTRGTVGILWSCILTLAICFWGSLHPDVDNSTLRGRTWELIRAALAPEFYTSSAVYRYIEAKADLPVLQAVFPRWTLTHSFYINMGGFRLDEGNANPIPVAGSEHLINCANTWEIEGIPSEEFIMDKSKASPYAKSIAFLQVLWFVLQTITRIAQRLPLSILELSIVPYALMTLIAMVCHISMPADVQIPTLIRSGSLRTVPGAHNPPARPKMRLPLYLAFCIFFSGWHCLGWNFYFPTTVECWVWRTSAVLSGAIPLITLLPAMIMFRTMRWAVIEDRIPHIIGVINILYVVPRFAMVVLMFAALRQMPAGVYKTIQWTTFFPHF
ncbi:hypothetical protein L208DRAFT_1314768 [Tricholoma matsutake]|nr:hypothetical protein L208DRAFT_1314768 [Tricholoma matsutake 945]